MSGSPFLFSVDTERSLPRCQRRKLVVGALLCGLPVRQETSVLTLLLRTAHEIVYNNNVETWGQGSHAVHLLSNREEIEW